MKNRLKNQISRNSLSALAAAFAVSVLCSLSSAANIQPKALDYCQTHKLQQQQALDGTGTIITSVCRSKTYINGDPQNDYLWNTDHNCFAASEITVSDGLGSVSTHATSIGGILIGNDPNANHRELGDFHYIGAAPAAKVNISEFWRFISNFAPGGSEIKTDVLTMSVGVVFESWWTRLLELSAEQNGTVIVASIGNGTDVCDPPFYPAAGANVIGVGVIDTITNAPLTGTLQNFTLARSVHSSCGPTYDGRCGVDIVAPGNCLVPDATSPDGYAATGSWSSFATPIVAGTMALLAQHAKSDPALAPAISNDGGNCVMKAILLNSATKLPYWHKGFATEKDDHEYSLDFVQGAGALNATAAFDQLTAGPQQTGNVLPRGWDSDTIMKRPDALKYYKFQLEDPASKFITVTLNWNRHYNTEYPYEPDLQADSDLRIELWASDKNRPGSEVLLDYSDTINDNIEHIHCPADPNYNTYEIVVMSNNESNIPEASEAKRPTERYALAWTTTDKLAEKQIEWTDLNGNGTLEIDDFTLMIERLNTSPDTVNGYTTGDINMDGQIDLKDIMEMVKQI